MAALLATDNAHYSQAMVAEATDIGNDEQRLVRRAKRGDQAAFESLYRVCVDKVYGLCLRMTGNVSEAEDCTQEAFIQAWKQLGKFRGDSAFGTWIHRIAVNAVLGRKRRSRREQDRIRAVTDEAETLEGDRVDYADTGELRDLAAAVERLPEGARHVFVLSAVYGYSHEEASGMLGIAVGTSKAQLHRARRMLAEDLRREGFRK